MEKQFTASEVRDQARFLDGLSRQMLNRFADRLEADEKAVPVAIAKDSDALYTGWLSWTGKALPPETPLYTHPQPAQDAKGCVWSEDEEGNWDTGCGNMFVITEGTPYDNEMGFCCYCGGKLNQVTQADDAMAKESGR